MPKVVEMLRSDWAPRGRSAFVEEVLDEEGLVLRIPLPAHGRTNSYLDICDDLLAASFCAESVASAFECGPLSRHYESPDDYYLLPLLTRGSEDLATELYRLQWAFNSTDSPDEAEEEVREQMANYEDEISARSIRFPDLADLHLLHKIVGVYPQYGDGGFHEGDFEKFPERRFEFYRSTHFNGEPLGVLQSISSWVIPPGMGRDQAFSRFQYDGPVSLLNADFVALGQRAAFLSEGMILTTGFQNLSDAIACRRFVDDDAMAMSGPARFYVSEFKDFALVELGATTVVLFDVTETMRDPVLADLLSVIERHRGEAYTDPSVSIDWSSFDDELFEQLCYDCIYHNPQFDNETIRKLGKSRSRDGGRDIQAMSRSRPGEPPRKYIFQCKLVGADRSLSTANLGSVSDVIDQYRAGGYVVMTSGHIDATVFDRLDGIGSTRDVIVSTWSRFELERFLARRPSILARYT